MSVTVEGSATAKTPESERDFTFDLSDIDTTDPPEPDSVGKTVGDRRDHNLSEPLPKFDTLTDIRWTIYRSNDPTVDRVLDQLRLDEDEWSGLVESICVGDDGLESNPIRAQHISDELRATLLCEYLRSIQNVCPNPLLMPLGSDGKEPKIVEQRCSLDSEEGIALLHTPTEAIEAVRNGAKGFCLYAGKAIHNTEEIALVDHDDVDTFPLNTLPGSLTVRSGSGDFHQTFINDGTVENAVGTDEYDDAGEVRADGWLCVLPGSVHPSGGVYHVSSLDEPSVLSQDALPNGLRPSDIGSGQSKPIDLSETVEPENGGWHNLLSVSLETSRERDYKLDDLLTSERPSWASGDTSPSGIDAKLVSKLRYHHFNPTEIAGIWKQYRWRSKLRRRDYVERTIHRCGSHADRFTPSDYFDSEDDPTHLVLMPDVDSSKSESTSLDTNSVRDRRNDILRTAMNDGEKVLIDCLPSIGKSYGTVKMAAKTESRLSIFTSRHDLYQQYQEWCSDFDLSYYTLPSFHRDCETANGDYGQEWKKTVRELYQKGVSGREIHQYAQSYFDDQLPCDAECSWKQKRDFNPQNYDVLIGNYVHAHNNTLVDGRTAVFDEFPSDSFTRTFEGSTVTNAVSAYLSQADELPFSDTTDLIEHRNEPTKKMKSRRWFTDRSIVPDSSVVLESNSSSNDAHAYAPLMTYALLMGSDLENGFETATLDQSQSEEGEPPERQSARRRHDGRLWILEPPELSDAEGVLCLDGTPSQPLWELCLDEELEHTQVLSDDEREEYLAETDGRSIIQTASGAAKPYSSGEHVATEQDGALFKAVRREMGSMPPVISTKNALSQYVETGVLPEDTETEHYGNMKGMNRFSDITTGIVSGSKHHGDGYIKRWCALNDEAVSRTDDSNTGNKGLSYTTDLGNEVLKTMRDSQTFQSTMRFGRNNDQDSVTFVNTDTLPKWVPIQDEATVREISDGMREVIYALAAIEVERGSGDEHPFSTKDITNRTNVSQQCVSNHMSTLSEHGYVTKHRPKNAINWEINTLPFNPFDAEGSTT